MAIMCKVGAIAQLVERMDGIHEVTGSSPVGSTIASVVVILRSYVSDPVNEFFYLNFGWPSSRIKRCFALLGKWWSCLGVLLMLRSLVSFFVLLLVFGYTWKLVSVHGLIQGLHLSALAIGFFIVASPLLSYLYVLGLLSGYSCRSGGMGIFVLWGLSLGLHCLTYTLVPKFYLSSPITKIAYEVLQTPFVRNVTLPLSLGSLFYHWLVSKAGSRALRAWLHFVGFVISVFLMYLIIPSIRDVLIIVFNAGGENF